MCKAWGVLRDPSRLHKEYGNMNTQHHDQAPNGDLERKANELISLMFSVCEEEIRGISMPDARASLLANAAMAVQSAIQIFLTLARR